MKRVSNPERATLKTRADEFSFPLFHDNGERYWDETAYYAFTLARIERDLEEPTNELAALCLELVDRVCNSEYLLQKLKIPTHAWQLIAESWKRQDPSLYGRFDFSYDGKSPAKLLEYNADTPTSLFEAAVFQWCWLEDCLEQGLLRPGADQFNSLHDKLVARWRHIAGNKFLHLACMSEHMDDHGTANYLRECARQAEVASALINITDIGLRDDMDFIAPDERTIELLFKLYPWEWLFLDPFSQSPAMRRARFVEPAWKAILSNKGILPLLWDLAPNHPNLLPAFFEEDPRSAEISQSYARKPLLSREGANISLVRNGVPMVETGGHYGGEGFIRQALAPLPMTGGYYPLIGSWLVGEEACGIGIRESSSPLTDEKARFIPHAIIG